MILMSDAVVPEPLAGDPVLIAARDQARAALVEITDAQTIGADAGYEVPEERVVTLLFESKLEGYVGWRWAASLTRVDDASPVTVLEVELLPGPDSLIAPEWVPWSERMSQYREAQARQAVEDAAAAEVADAEAAAEELDDDGESDDDLMTNDFSDFDDDFDGVHLEGEDDDDDEFDDDSDDDSDLDEEDELDLIDEASDFDTDEGDDTDSGDEGSEEE